MPDPLTGLRTHRDGLSDAIALRDFCCLVDIDALIWVNDQFGHLEGDRALVAVASFLSEAATQLEGSVFRVGGDEFLLSFSASDPDAAHGVAQSLVAGVRALAIPYRRGDRPERAELEVNVVVVPVSDAFVAGAFSERGLTNAARDWAGLLIQHEKMRLNREAGIAVRAFEGDATPWAER